MSCARNGRVVGDPVSHPNAQDQLPGRLPTTFNHGEQQCRPGQLHPLDTHHGLFAAGMLEVATHPAQGPFTRRPR